jgi:hypothetical protein
MVKEVNTMLDLGKILNSVYQPRQDLWDDGDRLFGELALYNVFSYNPTTKMVIFRCNYSRLYEWEFTLDELDMYFTKYTLGEAWEMIRADFKGKRK